MSDEQAIELLASEPMLIKRPFFVADGETVLGFKEDQWRKLLPK